MSAVVTSVGPTGTGPARDLSLCELLIAGTGGFARETAQTVTACAAAPIPGRFPQAWRLIGFLDDDPALSGASVDGVPVLGPTTDARSYPDARIVLCVGNPRDHLSRMRLARRLDLPDERYATIVHRATSVSQNSMIGPGSVLLAQSVLTASVRIAAHVAVMPRVVLTHDDLVEDYVTLASGVSLGGGVLVGRGAYIGAGALIREGVTVGAGSIVGMGSVVLRDVPPGQVWAGNPARFLRPLESSDEPEPAAVSSGGDRS